jgi:hypothetical protein
MGDESGSKGTEQPVPGYPTIVGASICHVERPGPASDLASTVGGVADDKAEMLDLDHFRDFDDALDQLSNSRVYDDVLKAAFARTHTYNVLTMFAETLAPASEGITSA